jgi:hypothetical protein
MELSFSLNRTARGGTVAPAAGKVVIARLATAETSLELAYGDSVDLPGKKNYTGYFLDANYVGAGVIRDAFALATSPKDGSWTKVEIRYAAKGAVEIMYNGVSVAQWDAVPYTGSNVSVRIGAYAEGATASPHEYRMDNVTVAVTRKSM